VKILIIILHATSLIVVSRTLVSANSSLLPAVSLGKL